MRTLMLIAAAVLTTAAAVADDKSDRERRVRVALALATSGAETKPAVVADCGKCREDAVAARADGMREGKPVVLFVGGCPGEQMADAVCKGGGIPVKLGAYTDNEHPPAAKRIVVLEPKVDKSGMWLSATLPATATPKDVAEAVRSATPKAEPPAKVHAPLNWQF